MMNPIDEASLLRILRADQVPMPVLDEYTLRLQMYHRDGNSGPLGTVGLIDLVRFMGMGELVREVLPNRVNWRDYAHDGSVRVEARYFGDWLPGIFLGFVEGGTLAVRLDDDPVVRECRPEMVRLMIGDPAVQTRLVVPEPDPPVLVMPPESPVEPEVVATTDFDGVPDFDWTDIPAGTPVWVDLDDDAKDGVFLAVDGRSVTVQIDGEMKPRVLDSSLVLCAK